MRDGQDGDDCRTIALAHYADDDDAGAVLAALLLAGAMFVTEVCVIEDKTRLRRRNSHASPLLGVQQGVEMIVALVHAGGGDRLDFIFGQIDGRETAPLRPETFEFFILVRGHEIACDLPVAGDRDGPLLGEHAIAAEIAGEFGGGDGLRFCRIVIPREKRKSRKLRKSQDPAATLLRKAGSALYFPHRTTMTRAPRCTDIEKQIGKAIVFTTEPGHA
jgi:hypothetical protein